MFYSPAILAKKGDLSHVWVAAHWHNKLTKQQVQQMDISQSVEQIKKPSVQLSLRLSGQLLHGVARIYQKKVAYLFTDCNEALVKIKMAFRPSTAGGGGMGGGGLNLAEASTPAKINAPAWDEDEDDEGEDEVLPKSSSSKRFKNVEIKVDEDDWTKMTPVHTRKSIAKRTPSIDLDYAAAAAAALEAQTPSVAQGAGAGGGESWSEFPFMSDEPNSIEVVRRGNDSNVRLSTMSVPRMQTGDELPAQEEYVAPDDIVFGDEFPPQQTPTTPGQAINTSDLAGLLLLGSNKPGSSSSAGKLKSTWLQDVESREQEPQVVTSATKKRSGGGDEAPKTVRKRANVVIELSDDAIKDAMLDTADICLPPGARLLVRDRIRNSRAIQARLLFLPTGNGAITFEQTNLPVCDEIAAQFAAHAKPVPFSSSSVEEEDDVEIAREEARARGAGAEVPRDEEEPKQEEYIPEDAPVFGDEHVHEQQLEIQQAANHELEETFVEEPGHEQQQQQQQGSEEERWNPQTIKMMKLLREKLTDQPVIAYQDLAQGERKSIVAKAFFEVLQLTTRGMVAVSQQEAFGEILITPGSKYDTLLPTEA